MVDQTRPVPRSPLKTLLVKALRLRHTQLTLTQIAEYVALLEETVTTVAASAAAGRTAAGYGRMTTLAVVVPIVLAAGFLAAV